MASAAGEQSQETFALLKSDVRQAFNAAQRAWERYQRHLQDHGC
jgi:hypothetical protein